nr:hypothetical protein Iba_chr12dCG12140 [Ipomoea batatas]
MKKKAFGEMRISTQNAFPKRLLQPEFRSPAWGKKRCSLRICSRDCFPRTGPEALLGISQRNSKNGKIFLLDFSFIQFLLEDFAVHAWASQLTFQSCRWHQFVEKGFGFLDANSRKSKKLEVSQNGMLWRLLQARVFPKDVAQIAYLSRNALCVTFWYEFPWVVTNYPTDQPFWYNPQQASVVFGS